jgi:outer membrane protein OmpA-like peptidoglycan-associated protein
MNIRKPILLAVTAGAMTLTACADLNTPTNNPRQRTTAAAGIGALAGALLGASRADSDKEKRENIVKGALLGGLAGGVIGNQLDKQAAELQAELGDGRIQIINNGNHLVVRMPQDILFSVDSARLQGTLRADLAALANNLQRYPGSTIEVTGHTDNTGTAAYNQDLSSRRASSVASALIGSGVSGSRIRTFGAGEAQPIASNLTSQGRAQNRRVDIIIRPNS